MAKTRRGGSKANAPPGVTGQLRGPPDMANRGSLEHLETVRNSLNFFASG
jgi:hypothetical protein